MTYTQTEKEYIDKEFRALQNARQENIKPETLKQWVMDFEGQGYSAEHVCKMIRKVRLEGGSYKLKFADFINCFETCLDIPLIIPTKTLGTVKKSEATEQEYKEIMRTSGLITRVHTELNIGFLDFLILKENHNYNDSSKFIDFLKEHPEHIICDRLDKPKKEFQTIGEIISREL